MGHKTGDGRSYVGTAPAGGCVKDSPYEIDNIFGFADADAAVGESVSLSIGQEEREVNFPGAAAAWAVGDPVYWTGTVFTQTATGNRYVGRVIKGAPITVGGYGWMLVAAEAWGDLTTH